MISRSISLDALPPVISVLPLVSTTWSSSQLLYNVVPSLHGKMKFSSPVVREISFTIRLCHLSTSSVRFNAVPQLQRHPRSLLPGHKPVQYSVLSFSLSHFIFTDSFVVLFLIYLSSQNEWDDIPWMFSSKTYCTSKFDILFVVSIGQNFDYDLLPNWCLRWVPTIFSSLIILHY